MLCHFQRALILLLVLSVSGLSSHAQPPESDVPGAADQKPNADQKPDSPEKPDAAGKKDAPADDLDSLIDDPKQGLLFRLADVNNPGKSLAGKLYWRTLLGTVAAQTAPAEFRIGGDDLIVPITKTGKGVTQGTDVVYPTEGRVKLEDGRHLLTPGEIPVVIQGGVPSSKHAAIKVPTTKVGQEVRILCAAVRFDAVDPSGTPVPIDVRVQFGDKSLLRKAASFNPLVIWLPVGVAYNSSLGSFSLAADGTLKPGQLGKDVEAVPGGLRKRVSRPSSASAPAIAEASTRLRMVVVSKEPGAKEIPEANRPAYTLFVSPLAAFGQPAWVAVSQRQYKEATGQAFAPADFSQRIVYRSPASLDSPLMPLVAGTKADGSLVSQAEQALDAAGDDVAWMNVSIPAALAGPVSFVVENKFATAAQATVLVAELGQGLQLVPHRWRTDFTQDETATFELLISQGQKAGEARVLLQPMAAQPLDVKKDAAKTAVAKPADPAPIVLGKLSLPGVEGRAYDARLFTLRLNDLPAGKYRLWVEGKGTRSGPVPLNVVSWLRKSPFLVQSMSGCTTCWPTSEEGLQVLQDAGLEMATSTGATSTLNTTMPQFNPGLAASLGKLASPAPQELALQPSGNDYFLARMLRHQLRLIDLAPVRAMGFYNESLSYHHSYQPSVDRMFRRMQIFTQQTGDYPSFWGVNYAWFPQMYGYTEGGVATDAHVQDRNRVLGENVKAAGFEPLSQEQLVWYQAHKFSKDPQESIKALALMKQAVDYWKASNDLGWGRHNQIYNNAIREVRPGTVCTLFENAGHDEGKRTRAMFNDMTALCFESYTDYGDWPMSAAFTTDWSRANYPGKPVWLTTCWGTSSEGKMKSLFHALGRGLAGGGVPLESTFDLTELARRGTGMKFVGQYGALAEHGVPDRRFAILSRAAAQALTTRGMWEYHALYYHMTRLGYAPRLIADEEVLKAAGGVPESVRVLLLADEQQPLEPGLSQAIDAFIKRGGKVIVVGESPLEVAGAIVVRKPLKHLWDLKGFQADAHAELWREFEANWREPLAAALVETGLPPLATTDIDRGYAVTVDVGVVRYVAVVADARDTHSNAFNRPKELPVSLEGAGWLVRDLVKQKTLPSKTIDNRTVVAVDLLTEPTTLLAASRAAPARVFVVLAATPRLGSELVFTSLVGAADADGRTPRALDLGQVPVMYTLNGPDGKSRGTWYRAAQDVMRVPVAAHDQPGTWNLTAEELITGVTATVEIPVEAAGKPAPTAELVGDVHVVNQEHVRKFANRLGEKLVIVEPGQQALLPIARKLTDRLVASGIKARLWQVQPEEYDTIPVRWYPQPDDKARLAEIDAGRLIGYRANMQAYIDKAKRAHVPELGGYGEIDSPYMVGQDCIVFSGGRLAESLRAVTAWMPSPNVPGRGQGRIVVCFSPFLANRHAAAIAANDSEGFTRAAEQLAALLIAKPAAPATSPETLPKPGTWKSARAKEATRAVPQPYGNFSPIERLDKLLASRSGKSVVLLKGDKDNIAFVDETGKVTATALAADFITGYARTDLQGRLLALRKTTLATHPGWHFPTEIGIHLHTIGADGKEQSALPVFRGATAGLPPDYEGGFLFTDDGQPAVLGRPGGWLYRGPGVESWRSYDDIPFVQKRFEVLFPRMPVGGTLSSDGRFLFCTLETRPPFGAFSNPPLNPNAVETLLFDLETGTRLWSLRDAEYQKSTYAAHSGFARVAKDGALTAFADYGGVIYLIDKEGKALVQQQVGPIDETATGSRIGPLEGVGVWMSDSGSVVAYGFRSVLAIANGTNVVTVPIAGLVSGAVAADGSMVVAAFQGGRIQAYDPDGNALWSVSAGDPRPSLASIGESDTLVATTNGELVRLNGKGQEAWRLNAAKAADRETHPLGKSAQFAELPAPAEYRDPETLAYAKENLRAESLAQWEPAGEERKAFGRTFYLLEGRAELATDSETKDAFVHLVYRRPEGNKSLSVTITGRDGSETFLLDLPTPEYRVIDLPVRGPAAKVLLKTDGPAEIAEFSLWSMKWPGGNLAYIKPASENLAGKDGLDDASDKTAANEKKNDADDLLDDLVEKKSEATGKLKDCRIFWPNSDPDQIAGPFLRAPVDPTQIVDDKRFGGGKLPPFADNKGNLAPTRGGFFTINFGKPQPLTLIATYDRVSKQSEVCARLALFTGKENDSLTTGTVLGGAVQNDQFWRLFPLKDAKVDVLGVHVFKTASEPAGLSEIEAYGK